MTPLGPDPGGPVSAVGLLLAAGAGRRAGGPKAWRVDPSGETWVVRSARVLLEGGCDWVIVVLGAGADAARAALVRRADPSRIRVVVAEGWAGGMGASLRAGLAAAPPGSDVLVHLVDVPDVGADVVDRLLAERRRGPSVLARACFDGRPGHPVLFGARHLGPLLRELDGRSEGTGMGARSYLHENSVVMVECSDLASGIDVDH